MADPKIQRTKGKIPCLEKMTSLSETVHRMRKGGPLYQSERSELSLKEPERNQRKKNQEQ